MSFSVLFVVRCEKFNLKLWSYWCWGIHRLCFGENRALDLLRGNENLLERYGNQLQELEQLPVRNLQKSTTGSFSFREALEKACLFVSIESRLLSASDITYVWYTGEDFSRVKKYGELGDVPEIYMRFSSFIDVVLTDDTSRFERTIFRITCGNSFLWFTPTNKPMKCQLTGEMLNKTLFVAFY